MQGPQCTRMACAQQCQNGSLHSCLPARRCCWPWSRPLSCFSRVSTNPGPPGCRDGHEVHAFGQFQLDTSGKRPHTMQAAAVACEPVLLPMPSNSRAASSIGTQHHQSSAFAPDAAWSWLFNAAACALDFLPRWSSACRVSRPVPAAPRYLGQPLDSRSTGAP